MEKRQPNDATASPESDKARQPRNDKKTPTAPQQRDKEVAFLKEIREKRSKW